MTTTGLNTKVSEVEITNQDKYFTTPVFNKVTVETFAAKLKHCNLVNKTDSDKKVRRFNKRITSIKIKQLEVQKKLNSLITKVHNLFEGRKYFTSNDGSESMFVFQPALDILELKNAMVLIMFLVGNQGSI